MAKIRLSPEARRLKNAYQKKWREKNPDKVAQYAINHWERKVQEAKENDRLSNDQA